MVDVSQAWIDAHRQTLLPETYIEITYSASEPGLQEDATPTANTEAVFSEVTQTTDGRTKTGEDYVTLEHGLWGLDGSMEYYDGSPTDPGYVSGVLSGADGSFATVPTITINFTSQRQAAIPGLVITWGAAHNEWPTDFRLRAYRDSTLVAEKTVTGNAEITSVVDMELSYYDQITLEILRWNLPYHRARCLNISLGLVTVYTKDDLLSYTHTQSADLLSAVLPKNEISFSMRNENAQWNPDNPTGIEQYLLEQQEINVRYGMKIDNEIEWIPGGTFWLSEWTTPANGISAEFVAKSAFEIMNAEYAGTRAGTLYAIAMEALEQADLSALPDGSPRYLVDESLQNITTDFSEAYTIAEVLQLVAHAGNCVLYQDRSGVVRIEPWHEQYKGYMVDQFVSYAYPEYEISKPLKTVSVGYGGDSRAVVPAGNRGEVQTVDNPLIITQANAQSVAERAVEILQNRKVITGEYRADVRLDALDPIIVTSKYASNIIGVTEVQYSTTGGAMKGRYTGRVVSINLTPSVVYANEVYAGEV